MCTGLPEGADESHRRQVISSNGRDDNDPTKRYNKRCHTICGPNNTVKNIVLSVLFLVVFQLPPPCKLVSDSQLCICKSDVGEPRKSAL